MSKAKSGKLFFSKEHTSRSNPEPHTDSYRKVSNSPKVTKTGHNPSGENKIKINKK